MPIYGLAEDQKIFFHGNSKYLLFRAIVNIHESLYQRCTRVRLKPFPRDIGLAH